MTRLPPPHPRLLLRTETHSESHGRRCTRAGGALLLVAITLLAYLSALRGGFIWDDQEYVVENPVLRDWAGLWRIWAEPGASHEPFYRPMTYSTFWLEYQCWGPRPFGFHLVNVLLHALNALLVWRVLCRLCIGGAWVAAAAFALHPVHVESVAWIIERKDVLSGCFYLAALLAYLRSTHAGRWTAYALSLALFMAAVLSREMAASLPLVLATVLWWQNGRLGWADLRRLAPFVAVAAVLGLVVFWIGHDGQSVSLGLSPLARVLLAGRALWFYAAKIAWPFPLMPIYPRWEITVHDPWAYAYPGAALALFILLWAARRRLGRGPLATALIFTLTLAPVLGFLDIPFMRDTFVADRFMYLSVIGPIALLVAAACRVDHAHPTEPRPSCRWIKPALITPLLLVLAVMIWRQSHLYRDNETFWRTCLQRNPWAWVAHYNLGVALARSGHPPDEVIPHLTAALALKPDLAEAHNRLGIEHARRNGLEDAICSFRDALRLKPGWADAAHNLAKAHYYRALELTRLGRLEEAIDHFQEAIDRFQDALKLEPDRVDARYYLAVALVQQHRRDEAIEELEEVLRRAPDDVQARALRDQLTTDGVR